MALLANAVVSALCLAAGLYMALFIWVEAALGGREPKEHFVRVAQPVVDVPPATLAAVAIAFALLCAAMISGAISMMRLQSYRLAIFAGILALLPWTPAWPFALVIGIWALTVLSKKEVREAFAAKPKDS